MKPRFRRRPRLLTATLTMLALGTPLMGARAPLCAKPPQPKLEKGKLLVASRDLADPNFSETVVLLVAYGPKGAMGLVINRPSDVKLSSVLPPMKPLRQRADTLYLGGPVARNHVLLLIRSATEPEDSVSVFEDVYASSSLTTLRQELERKGPKKRFHAYAGHAGWAPGQLEAELARGDWHVSPADIDAVFSKTPTDVWRKLIPRVEGDWVRGPDIERCTG